MFEMWLWRRVLGVKWTDRRSNEWVRAKVGVHEEKRIVGCGESEKDKKIRSLEKETGQSSMQDYGWPHE